MNKVVSPELPEDVPDIITHLVAWARDVFRMRLPSGP